MAVILKTVADMDEVQVGRSFSICSSFPPLLLARNQ